MSFFNPEFPLKSKEISHHPWEKYIKDVYSSTYKYGHNSVNNPVYPRRQQERRPDADRVKFTVIGNRVAKDFIYSANLVRGLHKYRRKRFDSPTVRGVTSVEWPKVWNDLKVQYGGLAHCLRSELAVLINDKFLGGLPELKELVESKYVYHLTFDYYKEGVNNFARYIKSSGRPCAYMHLSVNGVQIGSFIFMLYADIVPLTCENFLRLCKSKRGGYSGTPVHRIVKDCWVQCGGFGLKSTSLECENFIIPHDRRGVLCMANDGRHVDCSTQFFVLLQPAPWMARKYVAFGQLIDGEETLKKLEEVDTWHEAPTSPVVIFDSGIFNMECHGITINKGTTAYIEGHVEDLLALAESLYEALLEKVFLEIEVRSVDRLHGQAVQEEETVGEEGAKNIHATQRFMRKKEDIEQQLEKSEKEFRGASVVSQNSVNNDYDVEVYQYEPEEYSYRHGTAAASGSAAVQPGKPFYLPLTDVLYPGEIESTYDLKKFLKGHYCLESDLDKTVPKKSVSANKYPSVSYEFADEEESEEESEESCDSDDANEVKDYLRVYVERVSFAGGVIKSIAKQGRANLNLFDSSKKSELITDEQLRRLRMASADFRHQRDKKVSLSLPSSDKMSHQKIKRRQTGFVRPADLERIHVFHKGSEDMMEEEDDHARKVRIATSAISTPTATHSRRRPTAFARSIQIDADDEPARPSALARLYEEVTYDDEEGPTLKDYKPMSETHTKNLLFLTSSHQSRFKSLENAREHPRHSLALEDQSLEHALNLQHGRRAARKISSDYVKTIDRIEHKQENSLRSIEYAKARPALSVSEYQMKNQKYQDQSKAAASKRLNETAESDQHKGEGVRLPGDTPVYSFTSVRQVHVLCSDTTQRRSRRTDAASHLTHLSVIFVWLNY